MNITEKYIGPLQACWSGYATAEDARKRVASGGVVTALLKNALQTNTIDGVVVSRLSCGESGLGYDIDIVSDPNQLDHYATSAYCDIPLEKRWKEWESFEGRLAICCLPCHARLFDHIRKKRGMLAQVVFTLALFCGHNNHIDLIRFVLKKEGVKDTAVRDLWFDRSYVGGHMVVGLTDGTELRIPFMHFNIYRNLWMFSKPMCRHCDDHLGSFADISAGDIYSSEYRRKNIKHSCLLARSEIGAQVVKQAIAAGILTLHEIGPEQIMGAQKRILIPSKDSGSRSLALRIAGYGGKPVDWRTFRVRSFVSYLLLLWHDRLSKHRTGRRFIALLPRQVLMLVLLCVKFLNTTLKPTDY